MKPSIPSSKPFDESYDEASAVQGPVILQSHGKSLSEPTLLDDETLDPPVKESEKVCAKPISLLKVEEPSDIVLKRSEADKREKEEERHEEIEVYNQVKKRFDA